MTREELSELDRRIAESVARGEAARARSEEARAQQEIAIAKQEAAAARIEAVSARMVDQQGYDREDMNAFLREMNERGQEQIREYARRTDELIAELRQGRVEQRVESVEILAELRDGRDERRAMIEALLTVIGRLPPAQG